MFLKRAKVVIVKFMSIQHIFVILCLFPSYEHQGYFFYEKTQLFNILDRPFQPDLKTNNC